MCLLKVCVVFVCAVNHRCHFSLTFLKRLCCQAQGEHVSIKVRPMRGVRTEACPPYSRVGLTHAEARKWACHSECDALPPDINAHIHSAEKLLHHIWFTIWRQQGVFLVLSNSVSLLGTWVSFDISNSTCDVCFYFYDFGKKSFYYTLNWIPSSLSSFFFFFRLKIFLIHWNSDSLPSHAPSRPQQALTCPPSISSAVAGFYISLSNHVLGPSGPEPPSVRPVTYEGISVFITSVKAAVPTPSPKPRWRAAASAPR